MGGVGVSAPSSNVGDAEKAYWVSKGGRNSMAAKLGKHPIHPMLVVFPIGIWALSLVGDLIFL